MIPDQTHRAYLSAQRYPFSESNPFRVDQPLRSQTYAEMIYLQRLQSVTQPILQQKGHEGCSGKNHNGKSKL